MNIIITDGEKKCKFTKVSEESTSKILNILATEYYNPGKINLKYDTTMHPIEEKESSKKPSYDEKYKDYCCKCSYEGIEKICNSCKQSYSYEIPSKYMYDCEENEDD